MSELVCALCLFSRIDVNDAVTVMAGIAVCEDHMNYAQDADFANRLSLVLREGRSS